MSSFCVITTTFPNEESAKNIIDTLLEKHLCACAQIMPIQSFYRWKKEVCAEPEILVWMKTRSEHYDAIETLIRTYHPYEIPQLLQLPIEKGLDAYLTWMAEQTIKP